MGKVDCVGSCVVFVANFSSLELKFQRFSAMALAAAVHAVFSFAALVDQKEPAAYIPAVGPDPGDVDRTAGDAQTWRRAVADGWPPACLVARHARA